MTARILTHPKFARGPAIRAVHPVDDEELQAAAALLNLAVTRPEKRAEIVAKVADYLVSQSNGRPML